MRYSFIQCTHNIELIYRLGREEAKLYKNNSDFNIDLEIGDIIVVDKIIGYIYLFDPSVKISDILLLIRDFHPLWSSCKSDVIKTPYNNNINEYKNFYFKHEKLRFSIERGLKYKLFTDITKSVYRDETLNSILN